MFRQESTQRDDLGGGGGRDVKHPNTASPQDPPLVRRLVVRTENRCEDPSASLRFAQDDTPAVCKNRRLAAMLFCRWQNNRAVREAGPYEINPSVENL